MNQDTMNFFDRLPLASIVSDLESHQVLHLNVTAQEFFGVSEIQDGLKSTDLLKLQEENLAWYLDLKLGGERFQPIHIEPEVSFSVVLDCCVFTCEDQRYRLDLINTKDYDEIQDYSLYSYTFERSVNRLEELYKGAADLDENINDLLDLVLYVYAGDRALIFELDQDLGCTVDLYTRSRMGFQACNEKYKTLDESEIQSLIGKIGYGESYSALTEEMTIEGICKRMNQGMVVRTMGVQFPYRSGMKCFLCIENPRRFWKKDTFLKYASYLMANDFHVNKIRGYLEASYLLNKTLTHDDENCIRIYMLGGFEIQTSTGILRDGSFHSPQVCVLISFLLINRKRILSIYEISEALWPGQIIDNPYNQIKNVVFRARKSLEGVCQKPLIVAGGGTYMINSDLDIWIDTEEFERLCHKAARTDIPSSQRLSLYDQAFQLYRGSMLPFIEPELWLLTTINFYQILYTNMVNEYVQLLSDNGKFTQAFAVASQTIAIEPSNFEIYSILLESLLRNHRDELARKYYQQISLRLSKKQNENFRRIWKELNEKI